MKSPEEYLLENLEFSVAEPFFKEIYALRLLSYLAYQAAIGNQLAINRILTLSEAPKI